MSSASSARWRWPTTAGAALIDPRFDNVTRGVALNRVFEGSDTIALGGGSAWAADPGFVTRLDATTGRILTVIPVGYSHVDAVVVDDGAVWAIGGLGIVRIDPARDPRTNRVGDDPDR
jgi:streptogramin lyase